MGLFTNKYPYTDFHELNLDWVIEKMKDLENRVDSLKDEVIKETTDYIDSKLADTVEQLNKDYEAFKLEVNNKIAGLDADYKAFVDEVNRRMLIMDNKIAEAQALVNSALEQANAYTNQAIANNNDYIIDQTTKALDTVTVLNYFTGERITIQEMFDYLAKFHLNNAITVLELEEAQKTVNALVTLRMTMTDLATNGKQIIIG